MKLKTLLGIGLVVLFTGLAFSGAKRIETYEGTVALSLAADRLAANATRDTAAISKITILNGNQDQMYDEMFGSIIIPDFTANGDTALGNTDTAIVSLYFGKDWYSTLATVDTSTLPCTLFYEYYGETYRSLTDSAGLILAPNNTNDHLFAFDKCWLNIVVADSAGVGDTATAETSTANYYLRFIEKD